MGPEGHKDAILILVWLWLFEEIQSAQKKPAAPLLVDTAGIAFNYLH
jgi:hypothetical protein